MFLVTTHINVLNTDLSINNEWYHKTLELMKLYLKKLKTMSTGSEESTVSEVIWIESLMAVWKVNSKIQQLWRLFILRDHKTMTLRDCVYPFQWTGQTGWLFETVWLNSKLRTECLNETDDLFSVQTGQRSHFRDFKLKRTAKCCSKWDWLILRILSQTYLREFMLDNSTHY